MVETTMEKPIDPWEIQGKCPLCSCPLITNGEAVWCTLIGGPNEKACGFYLNLRKRKKEVSLSTGHGAKPRATIIVGCHTCGGQLAEIRGRYPKEPKREVCPTCLKERLEQINDLSSSEYGLAYQNEKEKP